MKDTMRRLAGDQDRIAGRARRLQDGLKQQASAGSGGRSGTDKSAQAAAGDAARDMDRQRIADRMQQAAEALRGGLPQQPAGQRGGADESATRRQAEAQQELARALDKVADKLASAGGGKDSEARKTADRLARVQELRDRMNSVSREIEKLGQQTAKSGSQASSQKTPGERGRSGQGQSGGGVPGGSDLARLREEYARQLKQTEDLLDAMRREDATFAQGGGGFTFEGQGMTLSAPGTEAFKQDFAKWDDMRKQATTALDHAEATLSKKLQAQQAKDRLAAGVEDKAPPEYQKQVDSYFKALATKKKQ
jgi:hypothetical protein